MLACVVLITRRKYVRAGKTHLYPHASTLLQGIILLMLIMHLIHAIGFQPRLSVLPGGCGSLLCLHTEPSHCLFLPLPILHQFPFITSVSVRVLEPCAFTLHNLCTGTFPASPLLLFHLMHPQDPPHCRHLCPSLLHARSIPPHTALPAPCTLTMHPTSTRTPTTLPSLPLPLYITSADFPIPVPPSSYRRMHVSLRPVHLSTRPPASPPHY